MSQSVNERVREVAVRMALGASPHAVVSGFLREAGAMTAAGLTAGLIIALFAATVPSWRAARTDPARVLQEE